MNQQQIVKGMIRFAVFAWLAVVSITGWAFYEIRNASNITLKFDTLDPARGTWRTWEIYPNQTREFRWENTARSGQVRIGTESRGYVQYTVHEGNRYSFVWDANKGVWDMRTTGKLGLGGQPAPVPSTAKATWVLENRNNQSLRFQTREPNDANWRDQSANPNETKSFYFSPGIRQGRIRISTENRGYVEYDIRAGWRYSMVWDQNKGVWDFRTLQRAGN